MWETGNINKEPVSCDNSGKEEQILSDCGHEGQEWYEDLKKHFQEWEKKNLNRITREGNRKPVVASDTVLAETCLNPEFLGNQKHPRKIQGIVTDWKEILSLKNRNKMDDEEEAMMDNREKDQVYLEEYEEKRARIEGNKDQVYLELVRKSTTHAEQRREQMIGLI